MVRDVSLASIARALSCSLSIRVRRGARTWGLQGKLRFSHLEQRDLSELRSHFYKENQYKLTNLPQKI